MMRVVTLRSYGLSLTHSYPSCRVVLLPPKHLNYRTYSTSLPTMGSPELWDAAKVRTTFIEFFEKNGHKFGIASHGDLKLLYRR